MGKMYTHSKNIINKKCSRRSTILAGTPFDAEERYTKDEIKKLVKSGVLTPVAAQEKTKTATKKEEKKEEKKGINEAILFCLPPEVLGEMSIVELDAKHAEICNAAGLDTPEPFKSKSEGVAKLSSQYKAK